VVDVTKDGDDWRAQYEVSGLVFGDGAGGGRGGVINLTRGEAKDARDTRRGVEVDHFVDAGEDAAAHQLLDYLDGLDLHPLSERTDAHRFPQWECSKRHLSSGSALFSGLFSHAVFPRSNYSSVIARWWALLRRAREFCAELGEPFFVRLAHLAV
jgi:hypothetical protein